MSRLDVFISKDIYLDVFKFHLSCKIDNLVENHICQVAFWGIVFSIFPSLLIEVTFFSHALVFSAASLVLVS